MKEVLIDTNFWIDLVRFRIDMDELSSLLQEPYKISTPSVTVNELEKMAKGRSKSSNFARLALEMVKLKGINTIKVKERDADKALLNIANKNTIIATNDMELRKRLKSSGIKTIYLRARKHLAMS